MPKHKVMCLNLKPEKKIPPLNLSDLNASQTKTIVILSQTVPSKPFFLARHRRN